MSNERLTILKGGMLRYRYDVNAHIGFDFYLLCEVGEPYQKWFIEEMENRGFCIAFGKHLDCKPWVADFVVDRS